MSSRYSLEVMRFAFEKSWQKLSYDPMMLVFFEGNRNVFFDYFHMTNHMDSLGKMTRRNDLGGHLNTIFFTWYQRLALSLQPSSLGRSLTMEECIEVFATLENRPTKEVDLMLSLQRQEGKYKEDMKSTKKQDQMYAYLYYHLSKGIIEQLLDIKREVKNELLYEQLKESSLSICQSCIVLILLKVPIISFKESVLACGFKKSSVSDFRTHYTKFSLNEYKISDHGRETGRDLAQVLAFLNANEYDVSEANEHYNKFKGKYES